MFSEEVVVLWSGGIDSTGLIQILLEKYCCKVYPIFVNRGQSNKIFEEESIVHYSKIFSGNNNFNEPLIVESKIPALEFKKYSGDEKYFLRNSDLINNAVRYATLKKIDTVLIATYADDVQDGREEYLIEKEKEVQIGIEDLNFKVFSPFQKNEFPYKTKEEVVEICKKYELDLSSTRSCYKNEEASCGNCPACSKRFKVLKS